IILPAIEAVIQTRPVDEWLTILERAGVPAAPINRVDQALADPQVAALNLVQEGPHPTAGEIRLTAPYVAFAGAAPPIQRPPPRLGEHTVAILQEQLGLDRPAIERLKETGAVVQATDGPSAG